MRKIGKLFYYFITFLLIYSCGQKEKPPQVEIKKLNYPSASAVEYYDGKLYIMGDDAPNMIILDTNLNIIDSVSIVLHPANRIPKDSKPDLEAAAFYGIDSDPTIFLFGSGSLDPFRNSGWKYSLHTKTRDNIYLQPLYNRIKQTGIQQLNIEGAAFVNDKLVLVNRGNKSYPFNHLIITNESSLLNDTNFQISIIPLPAQKDTTSFKGISGLCYAKESDKLIMTVSIEDTKSTYEDGAIGKSYLWIINDISTKLNNKAIKRDRVIDLEYIDSGFKGQKIESAVVIKETDRSIYLVLVADNDDGSSTIFKMSIEKTRILGE